MRRTAVLLASLLSLAPAAAQAQQKDTTRAATPAVAATAAATPVTPGATAAATELLQLMDIERVMRAGMLASLDAMIQQQPAAEQLRDVMLAWATRHMTWAEVGPEFVRIYTDTFTEPELRAMVAFYQTPTGRKLADRTPELTRRGGEVGAALAQRHMAELQQMVQARMAELQAQQGKAP